MKEFFQMMRRFVSPYKRFVVWAIVLNILSAVFNVFSFSLLIPILNILFKTGDTEKIYQSMAMKPLCRSCMKAVSLLKANRICGFTGQAETLRHRLYCTITGLTGKLRMQKTFWMASAAIFMQTATRATTVFRKESVW